MSPKLRAESAVMLTSISPFEISSDLNEFK